MLVMKAITSAVKSTCFIRRTMSERRPHWDDDLTDAVFRALSHTYRAQGWTGGIAIDLDESVYPLIAADQD
jgi:hypothetical protein